MERVPSGLNMLFPTPSMMPYCWTSSTSAAYQALAGTSEKAAEAGTAVRDTATAAAMTRDRIFRFTWIPPLKKDFETII